MWPCEGMSQAGRAGYAGRRAPQPRSGVAGRGEACPAAALWGRGLRGKEGRLAGVATSRRVGDGEGGGGLLACQLGQASLHGGEAPLEQGLGVGAAGLLLGALDPAVFEVVFGGALRLIEHAELAGVFEVCERVGRHLI